MPRASQIDADRVLDTAMALFWARGFAAVSIDDVVEAGGGARYGLYNLFGDKRGLYLAALERYQQVIVNRLFSGVEAPDAGMAQVRGYFEGLLAMAASPQGRWGCLMALAAAERAPFDDVVAAVVGAYRERLAKGFAAAMNRARRRGETSRRTDPQGLVALAFGLSALARCGATAADLRAAAGAGLEN